MRRKIREYGLVANIAVLTTGSIEQLGKTFELIVDYDDPRWRSIVQVDYTLIGDDIRAADFLFHERGKQIVQFCLMEFGHKFIIHQEVLDRIEQEDWLRPNRPEAETAFRLFTHVSPQHRTLYAFHGKVCYRGGTRDFNRKIATVQRDDHGMELCWEGLDCGSQGDYYLAVLSRKPLE